MKEEIKGIKGTCKQCGNDFKLFYGIKNTNLAFAVLTDKKLYQNDDQLVGVCSNPACPNYSLLQIR